MVRIKRSAILTRVALSTMPRHAMAQLTDGRMQGRDPAALMVVHAEDLQAFFAYASQVMRSVILGLPSGKARVSNPVPISAVGRPGCDRGWGRF